VPVDGASAKENIKASGANHPRQYQDIAASEFPDIKKLKDDGISYLGTSSHKSSLLSSTDV